MKSINQLIICLILLSTSITATAQCPYTGATDFCPDADASTFALGVPVVVCGTAWGTEHAQVNNMDANCTYLIEYCGASFNSEIGVYADGGGALIDYANSGCGDDVSFTFTPPVNGSYEFQMDNEGVCNTVAQNIDLTFTLISCVATCSDPDVPTLAASPSVTCPGANSTISISGSINDATEWIIYTGSCGGTQVGNTAAGSFVVSPLTTTTYYIRGEGGCVTPGSCNSVTITVQDITNPTISCPGNQTGSVNGSCQFVLPDYTSLATASDNCTASPTVTQSPTPGTIVGVGTTSITLTATDGSSNTASCNFNVVVSDDTNPSISCPGNQVGSVGASCNFTLPDYTGLASPSDNCPGVIVTQSPTPGTMVGVGTTIVTLTATDASSNIANCNFNVVVSDGIAPVPDAGTLADATGQCAVNMPTTPTATDNCAGTITGTTPNIFPVTTQGTTTITWTFDDGNGNVSTQTQDIVVADVTAPVISGCPGNISINANQAGCAAVVTWTAPTESDNCGGVTMTSSHNSGDTFPLGTTIVTYTATDNVGNNAVCSFDVIVISDLSVSADPQQDVSCFGGSDGQSFVTVSGGTSGFTFDWDHDGTGDNDDVEDQGGLSAGNYNLVVTDANGCTANTSTTINEPPVLVANGTVTSNYNGAEVSCNGACDGEVTITGTGGTGLYTGDGIQSGICPGTNNYVITDANGCTANVNVTVTEPTSVSASISGTTDAGCGQTDGDATATATGGTGGYNYQWDAAAGSQTTPTATALGAGTYDVTITDANGCTDVATATVSNVGGPTAIISATTDASCNGDCDGEATVNAVGGGGSYTYLWDDSGAQTTATASGLCAGTYNVTVTDVNSCSDVVSVTINEPTALDVNVTLTNSITLSSDATSVSYQWVDCDNGFTEIMGDTNQVFTATINGNYAVVIDNGLCSDTSACFTISSVGLNELGTDASFSVYPNPTTGQFTIERPDFLMRQDYTISIVDITGRVLQMRTAMGNQTIIDIVDASRGVYFVVLRSEGGVWSERVVLE